MRNNVTYTSRAIVTISPHKSHVIRNRILVFIIVTAIMVAGFMSIPSSSSNTGNDNGSSEGMTSSVLSNALSTIGTRTAAAACDDQDDNKDYKKFNDTACKRMPEVKDPTQKMLNQDTSTEYDFSNGVISVIFGRLLNFGYYINPGVTASNADSWKGHCASLDKPSAFTNDNCDVPGILTEGVQDTVSLISPSGIVSGKKSTAKTPLGLGITPDLMPTDDVPVNPKDRKYDYTGLEVYGYNLQWSTYKGEWDHIKVYTAARLTASIGIGDIISAPFKSIWSGMKAAAGEWSDVSSKIGGSGFLKVVKNIFIAGPMALAAGADASEYTLMSTILNGYEANAVKNNSWYRPDFATDTVYGARNLTDIETAAISKIGVNEIFNDQINNITSKYNLDENALRKQAAIPAAPAKVDVNKGTGDDQKTDKEYQDWSEWKSDNKDQLSWASSNLNVDAGKYDKSPGTSLDKYNLLSSEWKKAEDNWIKQQVDDNQNKHIPDIIHDLGMAFANTYADRLLALNMMYCADDNNQPVGESTNPYIQAAVKAGMRNPGKEAADAKGWDCDSNQPRQPIVGGMLGHAGDDKQKGYTDTRRIAWDGFNLFDSTVGQIISDISDKLLGLSQWIAMILNEIIGLSYQPILTQLGLKDLTLKLMLAFKDTIYLNLLLLFIAIGALMVFVKFLKAEITTSFQELAGMILTIGMGIMFLVSPSMLFTITDDVPSALERATMAAILPTNNGDKICEASGSASKTVSTADYLDIFGRDTGFTPDSKMRTMQCDVWKIFVLNPWSFGQFGTNIDQLYADGYPSGDNSAVIKTSPDVQKIVGDAAVDMGNNKVIHNWGLYQLSHELSGTSTTEDVKATNGVIDKSLYRLVDLQAGPDNAAGRTTKYFNTWKGDMNTRVVVSGTALASSIFGLVGIGGLALKKIEYTILMSLLLILMPIMMLIGILPGKNRMKLKNYLWALLSVVIKRVVAVVILSIGIAILLGAQSGSASYAMQSIGTMAIALVIMIYGKQILELFNKNIDAKAGEFNGYAEKMHDYARNNPYSSAMIDNARAFAVGTAGATLGYMAAGRLFNPVNSASVINKYSTKLHYRIKSDTNAMNTKYKRTLEKANSDLASHKISQAKYNEIMAAANNDRADASYRIDKMKDEEKLMESNDVAAKAKVLAKVDQANSMSPKEISELRSSGMELEAEKVNMMREASKPDAAGSLGQAQALRVKRLADRSNYMRHRQGKGIAGIDAVKEINKQKLEDVQTSYKHILDTSGGTDWTKDAENGTSVSDALASGNIKQDDMEEILSNHSTDWRTVESALKDTATVKERNVARRQLNDIVDNVNLEPDKKENIKNNIALSAVQDDLRVDATSEAKAALGNKFINNELKLRKEHKKDIKKSIDTKRNTAISIVQGNHKMTTPEKNAKFRQIEQDYSDDISKMNMPDDEWVRNQMGPLSKKYENIIDRNEAAGKIDADKAAKLRAATAKARAKVDVLNTKIDTIDKYARNADDVSASEKSEIESLVKKKRWHDLDVAEPARHLEDKKKKLSRIPGKVSAVNHDFDAIRDRFRSDSAGLGDNSGPAMALYQSAVSDIDSVLSSTNFNDEKSRNKTVNLLQKIREQYNNGYDSLEDPGQSIDRTQLNGFIDDLQDKFNEPTTNEYQPIQPLSTNPPKNAKPENHTPEAAKKGKNKK